MEHEPSIDTDKLSYEIFSILETNFLFGYNKKNPKTHSPENSVTELPAPEIHSGDIVAQPMKHQRGKVCVLSIDSGGMRGILAGKALAYLEKMLKMKSGDRNARVSDYVDVAAGSGVGGVFTAMLFGSSDGANVPLFEADDTWRFLVENGKRVYSTRRGFFKKLWRGSHAPLGFEDVIKEIFLVNGRSLTLKDTLKPVLIPCYDLSTSAPFLFSRADALESDGYDFKLLEVCCATSAQPGISDPVQMTSVDGKTGCLGVDGGLAMSNPTVAAITHVLHNKQEFPFVRGVEDLLVLSLGTGQLLEGKYEFEKVEGWKGKDRVRNVGRISGESFGDMVDHAVAMAFGESRGSNYVRIQANSSNMGRFGANLDSDPSPSNVKALIGIADEMLRQKNVESVLFGGKRIGEQTNYEKLEWFAGELVLEHQRRRSRIAPTVAFKQANSKHN